VRKVLPPSPDPYNFLCKGKAFANRKMSEKILLIEDEKAIAKAYIERLKTEGYTVEHASDGSDGLDKINKLKPDLVLVDLMLPEHNGISIIREAKANTETKDIPFIILSNFDNNDKLAEAMALGTTTYLVKSDHSLEDVVLKVKETLHGSGL
jgi:two-component system, OmpR family, response regulator VicR